MSKWLRGLVPGRLLGDLAFSARTFAGSMLALYIAFQLDLPRPYWAAATAYIVTHPLTGALRSKGLYRVLGTVLGAIAMVVMVPNLVNAPELLSLAMAAWIGVCLYIALLDRTPRSYVFMLAGYSAALIGFPAVGTPGATFDTALARVEEITLGIVCAGVVGMIVMPRTVGTVLSARLDAWLADAARCCREALAGRRDDEQTMADRRRLAADAVELHGLSKQLAYDPSTLQGATSWVRLLQQRMVMLLPILSSLADRMAALAGSPVLADPRLQTLLADLDVWLARSNDETAAEDDDTAVALRTTVARLESEIAHPADWTALLRGTLLARLRDLIEVMQDCRVLRRRIAAGATGAPPRRLAARAATGAPMHRDHGMALLSSAAAALTVVLGSLFWIYSGWPDGATAVSMAAVACCFFAAHDDPVPAIVSFTHANALSLLVAGTYLFAVLPAIDGFPLLVLALSPFFLVAGVLMLQPRHAALVLPLAVNTVTLMGLQNSGYITDFAAFINGGLPLVFGTLFAAIVTGMVRSVGAEWSALRLLRASWADIAAMAAQARPADRLAFTERLLDRIGMLTPRLAAVAPGADVAAADALADLRIGLNVLDLQRLRPTLPAEAEAAVETLLAALAEHFRGRRHPGTEPGAAGTLLPMVDRALDRVAETRPGRRTQRLLLALVGIRRGLFPAAEPYRPVPPPAPAGLVEAAA